MTQQMQGAPATVQSPRGPIEPSAQFTVVVDNTRNDRIEQTHSTKAVERKIQDANDRIANAKEPLVIITKDFLENYGYQALGWFSNGIPFAFESQSARDMVPHNYGRWVDEPVNNNPKIFDATNTYADAIFIVGKPSAKTEWAIKGHSEIAKKTVNLHEITPNMRAFNFEMLRPEPQNPGQRMQVDPSAGKDLCRLRRVKTTTRHSRCPLPL